MKISRTLMAAALVIATPASAAPNVFWAFGFGFPGGFNGPNRTTDPASDSIAAAYLAPLTRTGFMFEKWSGPGLAATTPAGAKQIHYASVVYPLRDCPAPCGMSFQPLC